MIGVSQRELTYQGLQGLLITGDKFHAYLKNLCPCVHDMKPEGIEMGCDGLGNRSGFLLVLHFETEQNNMKHN